MEFLLESMKEFYSDLSQIVTESNTDDYGRKEIITYREKEEDKENFNINKDADYDEKFDDEVDKKNKSKILENNLKKCDNKDDHRNHDNDDNSNDDDDINDDNNNNENDIDDNSDGSVSLDDIRHLSERVACLCVGFTGAEMKLLLKRATMNCLGERVEDEDLVGGKRKEKEKKNEGKGKQEEEEGGMSLHCDSDIVNSIDIDAGRNKEEQRAKFSFILHFRHFESALHHVHPSVTKAELLEYEDWASARK